MPQVHAYRALVDRERYAIVHAVDLLQASDEFHRAFPSISRAFTAQRAPWKDADREPGVEVFNRTVPLP